MSDRSELKAEIVGTDPRSDIAVLMSNRAANCRPYAWFGALKVEWVLAIGSPFGFDYSVTAGIVSAKGRSLPNENYVPFIQTDVAINPGNSGGPLFNLDGEVVGINSQIYSRTGGFMGVSFAIPIHVVLDVYEQLRDKGAVTRGWLGVLIQDVTSELAESFGMDKPRGALVSKVLDNSPAGQGGIETGDIIVAFNGRRVEQSSDLPPMVGSTRVGDKIPVEVMRGGKLRKLTLEIGALPDSEESSPVSGRGPDSSAVDKVLGLAVSDLDQQQRGELDVGKGGCSSPTSPTARLRGRTAQGRRHPALNNQVIENAAQFRELTPSSETGKTVPVLGSAAAIRCSSR